LRQRKLAPENGRLSLAMTEHRRESRAPANARAAPLDQSINSKAAGPPQWSELLSAVQDRPKTTVKFTHVARDVKGRPKGLRVLEMISSNSKSKVDP
jgi:hypothetical protein